MIVSGIRQSCEVQDEAHQQHNRKDDRSIVLSGARSIRTGPRAEALELRRSPALRGRSLLERLLGVLGASVGG